MAPDETAGDAEGLTAEYWERHCWFRRFITDDPHAHACQAPATWRGPRNATGALTRAWRACDAHRMTTDERL